MNSQASAILVHLRVNKFNGTPISSRKHGEDFKAPTVTEPRWTIFKDLCNLTMVVN